MTYNDECNQKLAEKIRFVADKLGDEDAADELHAIADEVEVDAKPIRVEVRDGPSHSLKKIKTEAEQCLDDLICELGWLIDEEEVPGNDYDAPRKKTKASRRLRKILLKNVPQSRIPGCTPWLQDEQGDTLE